MLEINEACEVKQYCVSVGKHNIFVSVAGNKTVKWDIPNVLLEHRLKYHYNDVGCFTGVTELKPYFEEKELKAFVAKKLCEQGVIDIS